MLTATTTPIGLQLGRNSTRILPERTPILMNHAYNPHVSTHPNTNALEILLERKVLGKETETHPSPTLLACGRVIRLGPHTKRTRANHGQREEYRDRCRPESFHRTHNGGVSEEGSGGGRGHARHLAILCGVDNDRRGLSEMPGPANLVHPATHGNLHMQAPVKRHKRAY